MRVDPAEALTAGLRHWTRSYDLHARAAVDLLIWHGYWLRRQDFIRACTRPDGLDTYIDWEAARTFVDAGTKGSTSEHAILDLAVALGEDRYHLSIMGTVHSRAIADAVAQAVGVTRA
jgi:hypothetical protein